MLLEASPLVDAAELCAGGAPLCLALSPLAHFKTHKIEGSCEFAPWKSCGASMLTLARTFPGALPTGARSEPSLGSPNAPW